jgi:hypothetical protein
MLNSVLIWVNVLEVILIIIFLATIHHFEKRLLCWSSQKWGKFVLQASLPIYIPIYFFLLIGFRFKITNGFLFASAIFLAVLDVATGLGALAAYAEYRDYCQYYRNFKSCACTCRYV